jgi:hypothetical protein
MFAPLTPALAAPPAVPPPPGLSAADQAAANTLGKCVVLKSTGEDRITFARWMVVAMASSPQMASVVTASATAKDDLDRKVAGLFTRLFAVDCVAEAKPVFATNNSAGMQLAGEAFGRIAIQELLGNREANAAMGSFTKYLKEEDFKILRP